MDGLTNRIFALMLKVSAEDLKRRTVQTMAELKPCPFCGGEAKLAEGELGQWIVRCTKCPCDVGRYWFSRKADAKKAWNRRADNG